MSFFSPFVEKKWKHIEALKRGSHPYADAENRESEPFEGNVCSRQKVVTPLVEIGQYTLLSKRVLWPQRCDEILAAVLML